MQRSSFDASRLLWAWLFLIQLWDLCVYIYSLNLPQEPLPLTSSGNIRGPLKMVQLAGGLSSCAWKPDRAPLTQNLKYQQRSIAAACYLLSSTE